MFFCTQLPNEMNTTTLTSPLKEYTNKEFYQIQELINEFFDLSSAQISLIWPVTREPPLQFYQKGSGIVEWQQRGTQEDWYEFKVLTNTGFQNLLVTDEKNVLIQVTLYLSVSIGIIFSFISIVYFIQAFKHIYSTMLEDYNHQEIYFQVILATQIDHQSENYETFNEVNSIQKLKKDQKQQGKQQNKQAMPYQLNSQQTQVEDDVLQILTKKNSETNRNLNSIRENTIEEIQLKNHAKSDQSGQQIAQEQQQIEPLKKDQERKLNFSMFKIKSLEKYFKNPWLPRYNMVVDRYWFDLFQHKVSNSLENFCLIMFRLRTENEKQSLAKNADQEKLFIMKDKELKSCYQKFCFLNNMNEIPLLKDTNKSIFKKFGYEYVSDQSTVQIKIIQIIRKTTEINLKASSFYGHNSVEFFLQQCYELTMLETDFQWVQDLIEKYNEFCAEFKLKNLSEEIRINPSAYGLETVIGKRCYLMRQNAHQLQGLQDDGEDQQNEIDQVEENPTEKEQELKLVPIGPKISQEEDFIIDREQLNNHFMLYEDEKTFAEQYMKEKKLIRKIRIQDKKSLMLNKNAQSQESQRFFPFQGSLDQTIYLRNWYLSDIVVSLIHFIQTTLFSLPIFSVSFFMSITYGPYSLMDPRYIVTFDDIQYDLWNLITKVFSLYSVAIFLVFFVGVFNVFDFIMDLYFLSKSCFPENQMMIFEKHQLFKNKLYNVLIYIHWVIIIICLSLIFFYSGIVLVWCILGAIIDPTIYLVYTSSASTLISMIVMKQQQVWSNKNTFFD